MSKLFTSGIDWERSKAFFLPSDHFQGFLSLNVEGREPAGVVKPGAEYHQVCSEIRNELLALTNTATGRPAVREVTKISDVYQGQRLSDLPDLVIQWAEEAYIAELHHPKFGVIHEPDIEVRKNMHSADGFMIACGKNINHEAVVKDATTMDLAPTILHLLDQPVPSEIEGKILHSLLTNRVTVNT
jgi:predicted AlkP superfamily phosphohydrolase/phosphomutase